jgi:hypothetical protein
MGGGSKPKMPPTPAPVPQVVEPDIARKANDTRRKILASLGRQGTVLVPNTLGITDTSKQMVLG